MRKNKENTTACDLSNKKGCEKCKNGKCTPCTIARICLVLIFVAVIVRAIANLFI